MNGRLPDSNMINDDDDINCIRWILFTKGVINEQVQTKTMNKIVDWLQSGILVNEL